MLRCKDLLSMVQVCNQLHNLKLRDQVSQLTNNLIKYKSGYVRLG